MSYLWKVLTAGARYVVSVPCLSFSSLLLLLLLLIYFLCLTKLLGMILHMDMCITFPSFKWNIFQVDLCVFLRSSIKQVFTWCFLHSLCVYTDLRIRILDTYQYF